MATEFNPHFAKFYTYFMQQLLMVVPPSVNIPEAYEKGTDDQQKFVQNLALFFTSFFKVSREANSAARVTRAQGYSAKGRVLCGFVGFGFGRPAVWVKKDYVCHGYWLRCRQGLLLAAQPLTELRRAVARVQRVVGCGGALGSHAGSSRRRSRNASSAWGHCMQLLCVPRQA